VDIFRCPCSIPSFKGRFYAVAHVEHLMHQNQPRLIWAPSPMDTSSLATLLVSQVGFGGTLGFLLGYGLKKVAAVVFKIIALISGLFMLGLTWLAWIGVISINFNAFTAVAGNSFANAITALAASLAFVGQIIPLGGSFGLGFYLGAKKG